MKLIILTSSIFYLLGLKLTHEVQIQQPFATDTVKLVVPSEQPKLPAMKPENNFSIDQTQAADSLKNFGSGVNTAPWRPLLEEFK